MLLSTVASPLDAAWMFRLVEVNVFVLFTVTVRVSLFEIELNEFGPVGPVIALLPVPSEPPPASADTELGLLFIDADTVELLLLFTPPLIAPPPVVFVELTALPEEASCKFRLVADAELLFDSETVSTTELLIVFVEFGPVVPIVPV